MSGFVYIWLDKKKHRFYIGSHWGAEDDGYICSSTWMKRAYKRRPFDFKRRILSRISSSRELLLKEEQKWLDLIKSEEVGKRYYNLRLKSLGGYRGPDKAETRLKKSLAKRGKPPNNQKSTSSNPAIKRKIGDGVKKHLDIHGLHSNSSRLFRGPNNPAQKQRGTAIARCGRTGNRLGRVSSDDPRWKTGEFIGLRNKKFD